MGHVNRRAVLTSLPVTASVAAEYAGRPIDVLINNAGIIGPIPIQDHLDAQHFGTIDYEVWEQVV